MAEKKLVSIVNRRNGPLITSGAPENIDNQNRNDNNFNGFSPEDYEISSSRALCSKFYVNHKERVSKEIEQRIFLRNDLSCLKCQLIFSSTTHLSKHNEFCGKFSIFVPGTLDYLLQNGKKLRDVSSNMLICPWCPVLCAHLVALRKHINKCKEANRKKNEKEVRPLLSCPECPVGYLSLLDLLYHLHCHYIGDVQCSRCGRAFSTTSSLVSHLNKCDMKKEFICGDCQAPFPSSVALQQHLESCDSITQCLKCAKVIGARRLSMDHIIMHLYEEWSRSGLEMDDGILYGLPNEFSATEPDSSPKHKFRRRKRLQTKFLTKKRTLVPKSSNVSKIPGDNSNDSIPETEVKVSPAQGISSMKNVSDLENPGITFSHASHDKTLCANGMFPGVGNQMYEIENDIGDSECVPETESFPNELLLNNCMSGMNDKDPLEPDTNPLFTPSLEGNDGLTLTVVNVEGGANLFNWDDENNSNTEVENTYGENLLNTADSNISVVSSNCGASYNETLDGLDGNEDQDSGIDANEDGDSNKDKYEELETQVELPTTEHFSSKAVSPCLNQCVVFPEAVQFEEVVVNSEVVVTSEVTISSEGDSSQDLNSKPKKYSVVEEHNYSLPKGQVLPWFKIRALSNQKLRAKKQAELSLSGVSHSETKNPDSLVASVNPGPPDTRKRTALSSKMRTKGFKSLLTRKKPSQSIFNVSAKTTFKSRQEALKKLRKVSKERTVFGEVCESLLLMVPESSLRKEHSNSTLDSDSSSLPIVKQTEKTIFNDISESSTVEKHLNSTLEGSSDPSTVSENIQTVHKELNTQIKEEDEDSVKVIKTVVEEVQPITSSTSLSSPINSAADIPIDSTNSFNFKDLLVSMEPLDLPLDSNNFINDTVDEPNGPQIENNMSELGITELSPINNKAMIQDQEKMTFNRDVNPPGLVHLKLSNTVTGVCVPSLLPQKRQPNVTNLSLSEKLEEQEFASELTKPEEASVITNTISPNSNTELQKYLPKPLPENELEKQSNAVLLSNVNRDNQSEDDAGCLKGLAVQKKQTFSAILEVPQAIKKNVSESERRLRNYRKERSMLSHGFKQIAASFPWKSSASTSTTSPSNSSKQRVAKTAVKKTLNSTSVESPESGVFKTSFKELISELSVLHTQALETRKALPSYQLISSDKTYLIVEVYTLLTKYTKILNKIKKNEKDQDFFRLQLKDFLADLLTVLDQSNYDSSRELRGVEEDQLTAGLRKLITKCSDALIDFSSQAPPDSGLKPLASTQSLMFVVDSDGSLQPHPNFQLPSSNNPSTFSKENLSFVPDCMSLPSCTSTISIDIYSTGKPAMDKTIPVVPIKTKSSIINSVLQRNIEKERETTPKFTEAREEKSKDVQKDAQQTTNAEHSGVASLSDTDSNQERSKKTLNSDDSLQTQQPVKNLQHSEVAMTSFNKDAKNDSSKKPSKGTDADVLMVLQSVPNLEHYDVVLMSSSDDDSDSDMNFESCSFPTNLDKEELNSTVAKNDSKFTNEKLPYTITQLRPKQPEHAEQAVEKNTTQLKRGAEDYSCMVSGASATQNWYELLNDSQEENVPQNVEGSSVLKLQSMEQDKTDPNGDPTTGNCGGNSLTKRKVPGTNFSSTLEIGSILQHSVYKKEVANFSQTKSYSSALQMKLMGTNTAQEIFANLKDSRWKKVKMSSVVLKGTRKQPTRKVGKKRWLSHFRANNYPSRKTMSEIKCFKRREMGREGLRRVTKNDLFSCKQCPLWFYSQRDLERLHVCARLILEKKCNSNELYISDINKSVAQKISKCKESEESKKNSGLQEEKSPQEPSMKAGLTETDLLDINKSVAQKISKCKESKESKKNSGLQEEKSPQEPSMKPGLTETNLNQGKLCDKEVTENNCLSPFESYVKMKEMRYFSCDKCPLRFKSFSSLHKHKSVVHTETSPLICHICGKQFSHLQKLAVHCAKSHKISIKSENCQKTFPTASTISSSLPQKFKERGNKSDNPTLGENQAKLIPRKLKQKSFSCKVCKRAFVGSAGLQSHINQAHSTLYKCPLCPRRFTYIEKLQKHCLDLHPGSTTNLSQKEVQTLAISKIDSAGRDEFLRENTTNKQETENYNSENLMVSTLDMATKMDTDEKKEIGSLLEAGPNRSKKRKKTKWRIVHDVSDEGSGPNSGNKISKLSDGSSEELSPPRSLVMSFSKIKKLQYACSCCSKMFNKHQTLVHHLNDEHRNGPFLCTICHLEQSDALQLQLHFNQCVKSKCRDYSDKNLCSSSLEIASSESALKLGEIDLIDNQGVTKILNAPSNHETDATKVTYMNVEENSTSELHASNESECKEQEVGSDQFCTEPFAMELVNNISLNVVNTNDTTASKHLAVDSSACPKSLSDKPISNICNNSARPKRKSHQASSMSEDDYSTVRKPTWKPRGGWKCQICQKDFGAKGFLERHCIKNHGAPAKYSCPYCSKIFIDYRSLRIHHKTKHSKKKWLFVDKSLPHSVSMLPNETLCSSETSDNETVLKKCTLCDKSFRRNIDLRKHKNRHHSNRSLIACSLCSHQFENKKALADHCTEIHVNKIVNEGIINLQPKSSNSNSASSLDQHLVGPADNSSSVEGIMDKSISEAVCQKPPSENNDNAEENKSEFQCADCPLSYKKYSCLKRHRILMHAEPASYYCTICGKGFSYPHSLKNHVMTHSRGQLNSKRSDRYGKGTWKERTVGEEKVEVPKNDLQKNALQDPHPVNKNPETIQSPVHCAEEHVPLHVSKEPSTEKNNLADTPQEYGNYCLTSKDGGKQSDHEAFVPRRKEEMKSSDHEAFVPRSKKEMKSSDHEAFVPRSKEEIKSSDHEAFVPRSKEETNSYTSTVKPSNMDFRGGHPLSYSSFGTMPLTNGSGPSLAPWNGVSQNAFPISNVTRNNQWTPQFQIPERHTCHICGLCLPSWHCLQEHHSIAHSTPNFFAAPVSYQTFPQYQTFSQDYTTYSSYNNAFYGNSIPIHQDFQSDNGSSNSFQELTSHSVAHCSVCGLCFPNLLALQEHYASHMASLSASNPAFHGSGFY